jgi:hypothetical protein
MKILLPIAWTAWGAAILAVLYGLYAVSTERATSPEAGRGLGVAAVLFVLLLTVGAGFALHRLARRESLVGVLVVLGILLWPAIGFVADRIIRAAKERSYAAEAAREGDFAQPGAQRVAAAIAAGDPAALRTLLAGQAVPGDRDRAGYDLLNYAIRRYRFDHGSFECVRVLLAAGADPDSPDPGSGWPPLMDLGDHPDAVRALVEAGADIEALADGVSPVVRFTGLRQWESAAYLVEKGARLDSTTAHGLSLDYYLESWRDSVDGDHPQGWDRLRAAIAARRNR